MLGILSNLALSTHSRASGVILNQSSMVDDSLQPQTVLNKDGMNCYLSSLVPSYLVENGCPTFRQVNLAGIIPTFSMCSEGQSGLFISVSHIGKKDVSSSQIPFSVMLCLLAARKHVKAALKRLDL